jgi:hypothetical protein
LVPFAIFFQPTKHPKLSKPQKAILTEKKQIHCELRIQTFNTLQQIIGMGAN